MSAEENKNDARPNKAIEAVLMVKSEPVAEGTPEVRGYDFNKGIDYDAIFNSFKTMGFQGTNLGLAIDQINDMLKWRLSDEVEVDPDPECTIDRTKVKCTIFFGYTSNMVSCGNREIIRYLCQHNLISAIVTTGGGIEEDIMKCYNPHYMGDFELRGKELRLKGQNRIGNLIVPNNNYCAFEDIMNPILDEMLKEQKEKGVVWSPSKIIDRLGEKVDNEESIYYWCHKNKIPVFCPGITDGSIGDMIYFHSYQNPGLVVDVVQDIRAINDIAMMADKTGMIILGGGIVKHHICNANLMRNGADYSVYVNTADAFDGSDAGATPDEAVSWGKIKIDAKPVKVHGEASIMFPLIVAQTFAKEVEKQKTEIEEAEQKKN